MTRHAGRAAALLVVALAAAPLAAQRASVVNVAVVDADTKGAIAGTQVRIVAAGASALTDSAGVARLARLPAGTHALELRRVGYEPLTTEIALTGRDTVDAELALHRVAQALPTVAVVDTAIPRGLEAFETRRKTGFGQFITSAQIDAEGDRHIGDILSTRVRGVRIILAGDGMTRYLVSPRLKTQGLLRGGGSSDDRALSARVPAGTCLMDIYVDGVFDAARDVGTFKTRELAAVEVYTAAIPPQYRRPGAECGVVLLWTEAAVSRD